MYEYCFPLCTLVLVRCFVVPFIVGFECIFVDWSSPYNLAGVSIVCSDSKYSLL